jgi:hypothetical protein
MTQRNDAQNNARSINTLSISNLVIVKFKYNDIQLNDKKLNGIYHNRTQHNGIQHNQTPNNGIYQTDTQHNENERCSQHKSTRCRVSHFYLS